MSRQLDAREGFDGVATVPSRRGLHGRLVDILGQRVIRGELPPGTVIEPDGVVAELEVSRTVVREAFRVLAAKGLLDARPRTGTFVLPRNRWNLLDADVIRWRNVKKPDARLLTELEEVRQIIEPWGARLAAQRRTASQLAELIAAFDAMEDAATSGRRKQMSADAAAADVRFHRAVLAAAGNELLDRLEALLEPALRTRDELALEHDDHGTAFLAAHRLVVDCIYDRMPDEAFQAMSDLLRSAAADTEVNLRRDLPRMTARKGRATTRPTTPRQ